MARILLVEDYEPNRMLIARMLEKLGHEAVEAGNGKEALDILGDPPAAAPAADAPDDPIAAVLLDVQMPVLDGLDTTRRLREIGWTELPVIALTAHALTGNRETCLKAGMNDYLAKPLTLDMLRATLGKWLPAD